MNKTFLNIGILALSIALLVGCGRGPAGTKTDTGPNDNPNQTLQVDGLSGQSNTLPETQIEDFVYENREWGYGLRYPYGWEKNDIKKPDIVMFVSPAESNADPANLTIVATRLPDPMPSLEAMAQSNLDGIGKVVSGIEITESKKIDLGDFPAYQFKYKVGQGDKVSIGLQILIIKGNNTFVLSFVGSEKSFEKFQAFALKMIDSFTVQ